MRAERLLRFVDPGRSLKPQPAVTCLTRWGPLYYFSFRSVNDPELEDPLLGRLLNLFVDICLLRAGPQDLPGSGFLLLLTVLLSLLTGTLVIVGTFGTLGAALAAQMLDILLLLGLLRLLLQLTGKSARYQQTASALFGSGVLINLVTMPLQLLYSGDPSGPALGEMGTLFYLFINMLQRQNLVAGIAEHAAAKSPTACGAGKQRKHLYRNDVGIRGHANDSAAIVPGGNAGHMSTVAAIRLRFGVGGTSSVRTVYT